MKYIFIFLIYVLSTPLMANNIYTIKMEKHMKVESTFSTKVFNEATIHVVFYKDLKDDIFKLLPIYVSEKNKVKELETVLFEEIPAIISYHSSGSIVSYVVYNKDAKQLSIIDLNVETGGHKISIEDEVDFPDSIFRLDEKTILINTEKKGENLTIREIYSGNQKKTQTIAVPENLQKDFKKYVKTTPIAVNTNEYVTNGPIQEQKVYLHNDQLIYILDIEKESTSEAIIFSLTNPEKISKQLYNNAALEKVKDYNSFLFEGELLTITSNSKEVFLNVFDIYNGTMIKQLSLRSDISKFIEDHQHLADYLKYISKGKIKPTVTVNRTKDNNLAIRIDQVDKSTYNYGYNWWFHNWIFMQMLMNQQIWMQQQIQNATNSMPRFTPNGEYYETYYDIFYIGKAPNPIEFVVDSSFTILKDASLDTLFKNIDEGSYLEEYEDENDIRKLTADFTSTEMRYIYQDRISKDIIIASKMIH